MNQSFSAFAPKGRTYPLSMSLDIRVVLLTGVRVKGYDILWQTLFGALNLTDDDYFMKYMKQSDLKKASKYAWGATREGKKKRATRKYLKLKKAHELEKKV